MTLITGDLAIGGRNRARGRMATTVEAAIHTARMSPRETLPSASRNQLASPNTRLPASRHIDASHEGTGEEAARHANLAGLAGNRRLITRRGR